MTCTRNWCALGAAALILGCSPAAGPDPVLAGNRGIARIILEDVLGKGKIAENERLYAENFKAHGITQSVGRDEDREATRGWRMAFPDLKITIEQLIADGDLVAVRYIGEGTNTGEGNGLPATGRHVKVSGITIFRIVDGKVTDEWTEFDRAGMMRQLGLGAAARPAQAAPAVPGAGQ